MTIHLHLNERVEEGCRKSCHVTLAELEGFPNICTNHRVVSESQKVGNEMHKTAE